MCGIFGFSQLTPTTRGMAGYLAWAMEERGKDSWGASNGEEIIKHLGPITSSWELPDWQRGIFHTRAKSVGDATIPNAHPFEFLGDRHVIGVHNGHINNWQELNKKYARQFEVDSMHIFAHLAEGKATAEIDGWGACAWYEDGVLHLLRFNMESLAVVRLVGGEVVFASTLESIRKAASMVGSKVVLEYKLDGDTDYFVAPAEEGWGLFKGEKKPFGYRYYRRAATMEPWEGDDDYDAWRWVRQSREIDCTVASRSGRPKADTKCFRCRSVEVNRKVSLLCEECFAEVAAALAVTQAGGGFCGSGPS